MLDHPIYCIKLCLLYNINTVTQCNSNILKINNKLQIYEGIAICADHSGMNCLRSLKRWDRGFESY
jgi:hypothetical protein